MKKRRLGNNFEVSAIGLGCMGLSFGLGPAAEKQGDRYSAQWQAVVNR